MLYYVDADVAATQLAIAIKAEKIIFLTNVSGILRNHDDESSLISIVESSKIPLLIKENAIEKRLISKVNCADIAVKHGVLRVHILNAYTPHSIILELLTDEGIGTMIME